MSGAPVASSAEEANKPTQPARRYHPKRAAVIAAGLAWIVGWSTAGVFMIGPDSWYLESDPALARAFITAAVASFLALAAVGLTALALVGAVSAWDWVTEETEPTPPEDKQ